MSSGPLDGVKVLEFGGIGPGPFCGMLLSDLGADVLRIDRKDGRLGGSRPEIDRYSVMLRGRRSVALDLKHPEAVETCLQLAASADLLFEGFRPGVMERLGLGPDAALARNPRLVFGRMTGWGQSGPLASAAGHDINYIALSGVLHAMGPRERPLPPLNLVGDFGGGGLYLAFGMLAALVRARASGQGQVVDAAIVDGAASLAAMFFGLTSLGAFTPERESNTLDGAAPFYRTYCCADGKWIALGPIEPQFYAELLARLGVEAPGLNIQTEREAWPELGRRLEAIFATRDRATWCEQLEGTDVCFAPVLDMVEAPHHPHNRARGVFVERDGVVQPAPAPRFSETPGAIQGPPRRPGADTRSALVDWGIPSAAVEALLASGAAA